MILKAIQNVTLSGIEFTEGKLYAFQIIHNVVCYSVNNRLWEIKIDEIPIYFQNPIKTCN